MGLEEMTSEREETNKGNGGTGGKDQWVGGGGKDGSGVEGRAGGCQCAIVAIKSDGASGTGHMWYLLEGTSHTLSSSVVIKYVYVLYNNV